MPKRLFIEPTLMLIIFGVSFFFPVCNFYFMQGGGSTVIAPQYLSDIPLMYGTFFILGMLLTALLSGHRMLLIAMALIALGCLVLLYVNLNAGFDKWATSPTKPTFGLGFWIATGALVLFGIRSFAWRKLIEQRHWSKRISYSFFGSSVALALSFMATTYLYFENKMKQPRLVELSMMQRDGKTINVQQWEYPAYFAKVTKYYTPNSEVKNAFVLDSIHVIQHNEKQEFVREFSKSIGKADFDPEEVFQ